MERLTEYDEFGNAKFIGIDNTKLYERLVCDETVALTIATNKLAEFEEFMEEVGAESLNELENCIVDLKQENQALKERWQKLKEFVYEYTSLAKECQSDSQASRMAQANKIYAKMEQMEEEE